MFVNDVLYKTSLHSLKIMYTCTMVTEFNVVNLELSLIHYIYIYEIYNSNEKNILKIDS